MHLISSLLFAISASCDNIIVGLSYGAKKVKLVFINNMVISITSGVGTFLSMLFGGMILKFIPLIYANIFGSSILILLGIYLLINSSRKDYDDNKGFETESNSISEFELYESTLRYPEIIDKNQSKTIEFKEAFILGLILCLNNIGLGIGASITGLNIYATSIASMIFSLIFIPLGYLIGEKIFSNKLSRFSETISACIILFLGIYELFI